MHGTGDYIIIREVCDVISRRGASIVAAGNWKFWSEISNSTNFEISESLNFPKIQIFKKISKFPKF